MYTIALEIQVVLGTQLLNFLWPTRSEGSSVNFQASANVCFIICSPSCSAVQLQLVPYLQLTIIEKNIIEQTAINSKVFVPLYCIVAVHKKEKSFSVLLYFQLFGEKKENKEPPLSKRNNNKCAVLCSVQKVKRYLA